MNKCTFNSPTLLKFVYLHVYKAALTVRKKNIQRANLGHIFVSTICRPLETLSMLPLLEVLYLLRLTQQACTVSKTNPASTWTYCEIQATSAAVLKII